MSITQTVTGLTRYRPHKRWFKAPLLVLQVEIREHGHYVVFNSGHPTTEDVDHTFWRDAMVEDVNFFRGNKNDA